MAKPANYDIANASGASVRQDLNNVFGAIVSLNADATQPTTTYAFMLWADTTSNKLKIRNGANSAWIEVGALGQTGLNIVGAKFPNITGNVTASTAELNKMDGCTATTAELNALNGVTAGTAELNLVDGCTATTAELNILDGVTSNKNEINALDMSASSSTSGQVLTSNGVGSLPTWQAVDNAVVQIQTASSRAQTAYTVNYINHPNGVEIAELTMTLTPKKSGNKMILDWIVHFETTSSSTCGFIASRNGTLLPNSGVQSNGSRNRWDVISTGVWDENDSSTPFQNNVRIVDESTLAVSSVYRILIVATSDASLSFKLNRSFDSSGQNAYENNLSTGVATEINVT
jgi:hypothetical protein